jgi:heme exporter protein CcmD
MGGQYFGFIFGSYAATVLVLGWVIASSLFEHRAAKARLARIEAERQSEETP